MTRHLLIPALLLSASAPAFAGKCDALVRQATTQKGAAVATAFKQLVACDKAEAERAFDDAMRAAAEVGAITEMALAAIDAQSYTPVWNMMEKIPDYEARDDIAEGVGAVCADHPQVLPFLQGAYFGLRDIQFGQWEDALIACHSPDMIAWTEKVVGAPPATVYDEKYNTITNAYAMLRRADALPVLQHAAIDAATKGGPFNAIIEKMDVAVQPVGIGEQIRPEDKQRLEEALVAVANAVGPEQAALVADRLFNAGAEAAAASLLPRVYPDRVQADGRLLYGGASIEACDGLAVVHYASITDPAKRWSILADVEAPLRAFKPRLKCASQKPWPVFATPEPVASTKEIDAWLAEVTAQAGQGAEVKVRLEKPVALP